MNAKLLNARKIIGVCILGVICFSVIFVVPEILIFWQKEARDDWPRMSFSAIIDPIFWNVGVWSLCGGIYSLYDSVKSRDMGMIPGAFALLYVGVRLPYYWIKRIVIDNVPAFGYNPDNIYAVTGINSMFLLVWWGIHALIIAAVLLVITNGIRRMVKKG
ncbi:MAG: hypothetical protein NTY04_03465 [Candidatus Staskawiczbacteria bacterium]|nr:hypothetical protein [Candidatus Staskawiczbacteria bacterium]